MGQILEEIEVHCYHCGNACEENDIVVDEKHFCCTGCQTVFEILEENNLCAYYDFNENAGVSLKAKKFDGKYDYLSSSDIEAQILDFKSDSLSKVTLYIPSIHCSSCVWLLENFNKIKHGVINARLNFIGKELSIAYNPAEVTLREVVELLATLGYEPLISLENAEKPGKSMKEQHRLLLRIGVVGFCFGNIMLLSFPEYFKLDLQNKVDAGYQSFFLYLNFLLALPVFFYGASDYLKGAYISLRENIKGTTQVLSVDIPIVLGVSALFIRSTYETFFNQTSGYWDSLAGLVLFLLVGKWLQQVTYDYLSFERDYKSYFPLAVKVRGAGFRNIGELERGDVIEVRSQELVPADSILLSDSALIDYSFVSGESDPLQIYKGELIYAGGKQLESKIELQVEKLASQSYLTGLWNNEAFSKEKASATSDFANYFSRYFTYVAIGLAVLTGLYWKFNDPALVWPAVTAVLMVACPCALTLAMPFTMNTTLGIFGRNKFFVKNQNVIQLLSEIDTVAFDKTGTLTTGKSGTVTYQDGELFSSEIEMVKGLTSQSTHPLSRLITEKLQDVSVNDVEVSDFRELRGKGIEGYVSGVFLRLGSADFLKIRNFPVTSGQVFVEIDRKYRGYFSVKSEFRNGWKEVLQKLKGMYSMALISGDNDRDRDVLSPYFEKDKMMFGLKPQDKLDFVRDVQESGHRVLMIGDGLNDAGALKQSHVGISLSEDVNTFSPACDVIMDSEKFSRLGDFIRFSKISMNIVIASFILSVFYNIIGIGMAASGILSPLRAAVFMPLSSMSVVLFAVGLTYLYGRLKRFI